MDSNQRRRGKENAQWWYDHRQESNKNTDEEINKRNALKYLKWDVAVWQEVWYTYHSNCWQRRLN